MCGIFIYVNHNVKKSAKEILDVLINGLRRLEYRGYDSAGLCVDRPAQGPGEKATCVIVKKIGNVQVLHENAVVQNCGGLDLEATFEQHTGIAHTRWATHGEPCDHNAHPHTSDAGNTFTVVHNGIMTNYDEMKQFLKGKGLTFHTETDTEVIAVLTKFLYDEQQGNVTFPQLVTEVTAMVQGAYALAFKSSSYPNEIVACKKGSPMVLGVKHPDNQDKRSSSTEIGDAMDENVMTHPSEVFIASDAIPIIEHTKRVIYMEDHDLIHVANGKVVIMNQLRSKELSRLKAESRTVAKVEMELESIAKGQYPHFMLKEIYEQPQTATNALRGRLNFENYHVQLGGIVDRIQVIRRARRLVMIACGTSLHACMAVRAVTEELTQVPVTMENASDFLDRRPPVFRDDVIVFVSQSGETADTLRCLEYCKESEAVLVGFTNTVGSAIARATHCGAYLHCGPEIGVASTKAYTSQILCLLLLALEVSADSVRSAPRRKQIIDGLATLSSQVADALQLNSQMKDLAERLKDSKSILVMGRGYQFATCLEAALKIKELAYIHTEGINTGELKHGPLALIDENLPVIILCPHDHLVERTRAAIQQVAARKGKPIVITTQPEPEIEALPDVVVIRVPETIDCLQVIINVVPLQLLSYHLALARGCNVDFPRNLAKSVTVQ